MSELWQTLLNDMPQGNVKTEQPTATQPNPPIQTNPQLNQHADAQVNRIQNTPRETITLNPTDIGQMPASLLEGLDVQQEQKPVIELTQLNDDTPFDDDDDDDDVDDDDELEDLELELSVGNDDLLEGETPPTNNFVLQLPQPIQQTQQPEPTTVEGMLNNLFQQQSQPVNVEQLSQKRGRGRPPKVNNAVGILNDITNLTNQPQIQPQELSKSPQQGFSSTQTQGKDIAIAIPKSTCREIGESLQRIAAALIHVSQE